MKEIEIYTEELCKKIKCEETEIQIGGHTLKFSDRESIKRSLLEIKNNNNVDLDAVLKKFLKLNNLTKPVLNITLMNLDNPSFFAFVVETLSDTIRGKIPLDALKDILPFASFFRDFDRLDEEIRLLENLKPDMGFCINFIHRDVKSTKKSKIFSYVPIMRKNDEDCSVGAVRKMRDGVTNDDRTCYTCPYFIPKEIALEGLIALKTGKYKKLENLIEKRQKLLYGDTIEWM